MSNKIIFHSNRLYNNISNKYNPILAKQVIPKWYSLSDRYIKMPNSNEYYLNHLGGKMLNFKACPALLDTLTSGYLYVTPCDIEFIKDSSGNVTVKTEPGFEDFCSTRPAMSDFKTPFGCIDQHFHWYPNWAPRLPEGYSALYTNPINHFELPFINTAGIIDNDKMDTPGLIPFFLNSEFEGVIKAGTPYLQILPFKREDWNMEIVLHNYDEIVERHNYQAMRYRTKDGGAYKNHTWSRKKYE